MLPAETKTLSKIRITTKIDFVSIAKNSKIIFLEFSPPKNFVQTFRKQYIYKHTILIDMVRDTFLLWMCVTQTGAQNSKVLNENG